MVTKVKSYRAQFSQWLHAKTGIAPLVVFRIIFGLMMFAGTVRFWAKGWIDALFIQPDNFFHYYGFEWVKPMGEFGMYTIFVLLLISSLFIALGLFYRWASVIYFILFTYIELIDIANYLNHYYFISLVALLMCFLPANRSFSVDVWRRPNIAVQKVSNWTVAALKFQLGLVYFFAGVAKLNQDWLFDAMPMSIWLQAKTHWPIVGHLFAEKWVAYSFSWMGCIFDLTVVFFLLSKRSRPFAYLALVVFHVITGIMFPIGMFPWIMILATLIFFSTDFHEKIIIFIRSKLNVKVQSSIGDNSLFLHGFKKKFLTGFLLTYVFFQMLFPFRYLLYPGDLFWTEQGYRFSWRVMLMEKAGTAFFYVTDPKTGKRGEVNNCQFLTPTQEKMMATQPDLILQYAHMIKQEVESRGLKDPIINAEVYVTLNGSRSKLFIDPKVNLAALEDDLKHKDWILDF
ncbi:MAG: HTTM domain-containing protein [Flavobacteriales bacterium]|nr:HTTM domain-containing protein [Flavobacteriales bacterium]